MKIFRSLRGLTQPQMAQQIGVTLSVWKNLEQERTGPELKYLEKISKITGVRADDLVNKELTEEDFAAGKPVDYKVEYEKALDKILELKAKIAFAPDMGINQEVGAIVGVGAIKEISDVEQVVINPDSEKTDISTIEKHLLEILKEIIGIQKDLQSLKEKIYPA